MTSSALSSQALNNARFNEEAAQWDTNEKHVESVNRAFDAIKRRVPAFADGTSKNLDVLEIGCGTGLLSFQLAPLVRSLVGVDTSDGMISAFNKKVAALPDHTNANLAAINVLVQEPDDVHLQKACAELAARRGNATHDTPHRFDLIVSHLTLHHIPSLQHIATIMRECLRTGGMLALTDYEDFGPQAIKFHPQNKREGVEWHGIKKTELEKVVKEAGFSEVHVHQAFVLRKEVDAEGESPAQEMDFPFLLCFAKK